MCFRKVVGLGSYLFLLLRSDSDFEYDDSHIDEANHAMLEAAEAGHEDIIS